MAKLIKTNGEVRLIYLPNDNKRLAAMQSMVGGYIEVVHVGEDVLICDEEALLRASPILNTTVAQLYYIELYGDVLVMSGKEFAESQNNH